MAPDSVPREGRHRDTASSFRLFRLVDRWLSPLSRRLGQAFVEDASSLAELAAAETESSARKAAWSTYPPMTLGAAAVCAAFAMSRADIEGAAAVYWGGQCLLVIPCIVGCLRRTWSLTGRLGALQLLSALQSMIAWAYSPDQFRFPDELQHVRTAQDIALSGHLFTPNAALPVSPGFPALEVVTTALSHLSGLSLFAAGVVTVSVAHVLLITAVFLLARAIGLGPRVSAAATLAFGFAPDYGYFDTLFTYTAIALPFLVLALRAVARSLRGRDSVLLVLPPLLLAVISHHLTGYLTCLLVAAFALLGLRARRRDTGPRLLAVAVAASAAAVAWTLAFAPNALDYLATPTKVAIFAVLSPRPGGAGDAAVHGAGPPRWASLLGLGGTALVLAAAVLGAVVLWRSDVNRATRWLGLGAVAYPAVLVVRLVVADGPEISTRLLAYAMLFVCLPLAATLVGLWGPGRSRYAVGSAVVAAGIMAIGAVVVGTPASYERLPGSFHVAATESGVDERVSAAAAFAVRRMAPGSIVACDLANCSLASGYADITATSDATPMFYAGSLALRDAQIARLRLDYIMVDDRISRQDPAAGIYFPGEGKTGAHPRPYPSALIQDFFVNPLLSLIYDNGSVQIYDATRVWR